MTGDGGLSARVDHRLVDAALLLLTGVLLGLTIVVVTVPAVAPAVVSERLDLAIVTAATLVAGAVAALEWQRGRVGGDGAALLRGSAFAVLAVLNGLTLGVLLMGLDSAVGGTLDQPGQMPPLAGVVGRGSCALLLVLSGLPALRRHAAATSPSAMLLGPATLVALVLVVAASAQDRLPELASAAALERLADEPTAILTPGSAPILVLVQSAIGIGFLAAAVLAHRSYRRSGRLGEAFMAAGLVVAAYSQVHVAIHPGGYATLTTTADILRLAFYGLLLGGIVVDRRDDLRELRAATLEVRRLADAELASIALEERARLAREIHDGLAQDLWYAKLKQARLAQVGHFGSEAQVLSDEVGTAIDAALAEARDAVAALREGSGSGPLLDMLERQVGDFSDRFALQAELSVEGPPPELGPRAEAELLRIVQEALTNARRHADATVVRVTVSNGEQLRIVVSDNGKGFRPSETAGGFGLDSMRQRAAIIGASLVVRSEALNGTSVEVVLPKGEGR